ncbi:hypothetical protein CWO07_24555 [Vibrio splendidus]|uniref:Uncharacterized protein n=1 Tax=Vibrio splendidus TaxID=29497 RepID=A0A2T5EID4_VIBSP|nr:hypothetical protein CWO07_24555 [Vibrio splendidus]
MLLLRIVEKCKRVSACNSVTQKWMRQIKGAEKLIRFSNQLRHRHTFASQKMNGGCCPETTLWTLFKTTSLGGWNG